MENSINKEEVNETLNRLYKELTTEIISDETINEFFGILLQLKNNLINKKIELELSNNSSIINFIQQEQESEELIEINNFIKMITELEGKYKKHFWAKNNERKLIFDKAKVIREFLIDKSFLEKLLTIN